MLSVVILLVALHCASDALEHSAVTGLSLPVLSFVLGHDDSIDAVLRLFLF